MRIVVRYGAGFLLAASVASLVFAQGRAPSAAAIGAVMSRQHRSQVAAVVEGLVSVAGKDRNIGEEVRQVAQEQQDSNERANEAIEAVESRPAWKQLLFGSDYRNLGALRSEIVTTQNTIDRLTNALDRVASDTVKADLNAQITALKDAQTNIQAFIERHESAFSVFGWIVRWFSGR